MSFESINSLGKKRKPFLFISDFMAKNIDVILLEDLEKENIAFSIDEKYRYKKHSHFLKKKSIEFSEYSKRFDVIIEEIRAGNSYILNLTQATKIQTTLTLNEIYALSNAHYKLYYKDKFVCFSPEKFIQIKDDTIHTFPMKGTIDASLINAEKKILADAKEMAEHVMIVDLLRNDLSIVAKDVKVEKFRYITEIEAGEKKLLQVSSHISGKLQKNWHNNLGTILQSLLPAGSISGAPKRSTLEILQRVEGYERGHFSGVFGFYDGETFDSGVMIRFVEKTADGFIYKSGGGITLDSDVRLEYEELQDKIYLP